MALAGFGYRWAGLASIDRFGFGGITETVATAAMALVAAGSAGDPGVETTTYPNAGLIGPYIAIAEAAVAPSDEEGAGVGALGFASAAISTSVLDLTYPYAGLIGPGRSADDISDVPVSELRFTLSAVLNGTLTPINRVEFGLPLIATVAGNTAEYLARRMVGTAGLNFAANARAGHIATSSWAFTAFGAGTSTSSVQSRATGESAWAFASAATGSEDWPIVMTANLAFAAPAVSEATKEAVGTSTITWATNGTGYQTDGIQGVASLSFSAAALAEYRVLAAAEAGIGFVARASSYLRSDPTRTVRAPAGRRVRVSR